MTAARLAEILGARTAPVLPLIAVPAGEPDAVDAAADRTARAWGLPEPELLRRAMNGVFACGDVVLRVGRPSADPTTVLDVSAAARQAGVRTPAARRSDAYDAGGGLWVTAWERIHPTSTAPDWERVGAMVRAFQTVELDATRLPWCGDFPWWRFGTEIDDLLASVDGPAAAGLRAAIARSAGWEAMARRSPLVVCHGDVHPGNVLVDDGGPVLIDWDLACIGPAAWDHSAMLTWEHRWGGDAGASAAFANGYGTSFVGDPIGEALAELRLVAATLMRVRAALTDPSAAQEAEARLRYWRGDADAPQWRAQ